MTIEPRKGRGLGAVHPGEILRGLAPRIAQVWLAHRRIDDGLAKRCPLGLDRIDGNYRHDSDTDNQDRVEISESCARPVQCTVPSL